MGSFAAALSVLNAMRSERLVAEYALAGATAMAFWSEPVATYDLAVLVLMPPDHGPLLSLSLVYRWCEERGHSAQDEHILIEGVPTQIIPSTGALADEAIANARELDYEGVPVRVVRLEWLVALFLHGAVATPRRRERAATLMELPTLDRDALQTILERHGITA